jgi:hypothetical protein
LTHTAAGSASSPGTILPEALALTAANRTTPERVRLFETVLRETNCGRSVASQIRHLKPAEEVLDEV